MPRSTKKSAQAHVPAVPGTGGLFAPTPLPIDQKQQQIVESREALGGRTTYFAGPIPSWLSTYGGGLTAERITGIHREVMTSGWMANKASIDEDLFSLDPHIQAVDGSFRDSITGRPFSIEPADDSDLALHVADYLTAVVGQIDSYSESCRRLLFGNAAGYALEEVVYDETPQPLHCIIGGEEVEVWGHHPRERQWVTNKHTKWNVGTDELLIDMGRGAYITPPRHKFVRFDASGDFQARRRGYMYPASYYLLVKNQAVVRWACVLEIWGIPVPHGKVSQALWQDITRRVEHEAMLVEAGRGKPFLTTDDFEIEKAFELTSADSRGMHAALIGWINTELSKVIQSESLTTEVGGPGSFALSKTHAQTFDIKVANCARRLSENERKWYREVLRLACYEINADGSTGDVDPRGLCGVLSDLHRRKVTPSEVLSKVGIPNWRVMRESDPSERMNLFSRGVNELGLKIDESQPYREFGFKRPGKKDRALSGKALVAADTDRVTPSVGATPPAQQQLDLDLATKQAA